ncbi:MAG TPA: CDP-alcohol phosphatidyltransferase family protein [candidate division Zixibacteria bacterium]|nr:CDP-alcohol phosphatidyltransferase family protein [candidate division Zixibacteria bacterium]
MTQTNKHKRVNDILLGPLERPALQWFCIHMPSWVTPDILTIIGIFGSVIIFAGYVLSNTSSWFLWLASIGFVVNWFGDSLDGSLARYRKIERPKYGFFVDHTVDAFSQLLIFAGMGLSPYVSFNIAILALVGYLLMTVYVYVDTYVTGVFTISFGKFGPTEIRVIAVITNITFFIWASPTIELWFGSVSIYDIFILGIATVLITLFVYTVIRRALVLAKME